MAKLNHIAIEKGVKPSFNQEVLESTCGCGKTPLEHDSLSLLSRHHYWYFHKTPMKGCVACEGFNNE